MVTWNKVWKASLELVKDSASTLTSTIVRRQYEVARQALRNHDPSEALRLVEEAVSGAELMELPLGNVVQGHDTILMSSEFASASRTIRMNSKEKSPTDSWMGWSIGRWEGNTLIIDVTDQIDQTWFDRAGDFHSEALKVVERYTLTDRNTITYEATMEDPKVFKAPLTARVTYRRVITEWTESVCADNPMEHYKDEWIGLPKADRPDF